MHIQTNSVPRPQQPTEPQSPAEQIKMRYRQNLPSMSSLHPTTQNPSPGSSSPIDPAQSNPSASSVKSSKLYAPHKLPSKG
ncbi:MAG: hypothetical protein AAGJ35_07275, partial [Myxococcota bacterium]